MTKREEFIILLDTEVVKKSDVIVILEGDGLSRYKKAIELYKQGISSKICFSGNFDHKESGAYTYDIIKPLLLEAGVNEDDLIFEGTSLNTKEQAIEIVKMAKKYSWSRITLIASHYHTYRAFLTFLQEIKNNSLNLIVDMASVRDLDWFEETGYGRRIDLLSDELKKIDVYHSKGDVIGYEEGVEYLKWKYQLQKK